MSWNGTVHCGFCGGRGHNRLGCPERKKKARENPDSFLAREVKREEESRRESVKNRRCTYCGEKGHNRRGCKAFKEDERLISLSQKEYLEEFSNEIASAGLGIGSLVKVPQGHANDRWGKYILGMITAVHWSNVDFSLENTDSWHSRKNVLRYRVVGTSGWADDPGSWHGPPRHNQEMELTAQQVSHLMPNSIGYTANETCRAAVVSPSSSINAHPEVSNRVQESLARHFNLYPGKGDTDYFYRRRLNVDDKMWSRPRPELSKLSDGVHEKTQ